MERHVVDALRSDGHRVLYVAEMDPGISDDHVLDLAANEGAILVTSDKDFGELVFRQGRAHQGVILIRLHGMDPIQKAESITSAVAEHGERLARAFSVVEQGRIRLRRRQVE
jgi:predicted nuclease of predicted toxin-antitoxin system